MLEPNRLDCRWSCADNEHLLSLAEGADGALIDPLVAIHEAGLILPELESLHGLGHALERLQELAGVA